MGLVIVVEIEVDVEVKGCDVERDVRVRTV